MQDFNKPSLTHLDAQGQAQMVDVSGKVPTIRQAVAEARVRMLQTTFQAFKQEICPKAMY